MIIVRKRSIKTESTWATELNPKIDKGKGSTRLKHDSTKLLFHTTVDFANVFHHTIVDWFNTVANKEGWENDPVKTIKLLHFVGEKILMWRIKVP